MITIKKLTWDNFFSYGENNILDLNSSKVLQITGINGSGKSSIAIILQEILFGKNSKGIKKQDILNRKSKNKNLVATLEFTVDNSEYVLELKRKSAIKLKLIKDGKDISSHTSTQTYKTISDILGIDFKTFSQITYQSSNSNLQFLASTDVSRKQFLINLFNLEIYTRLYDIFKEEVKKANTDVSKLEGEISTFKKWIEEHSKISLEKRELKELPTINPKDISNLSELKAKLSSIEEANKKINDNNEYIKLLENINVASVEPKDYSEDINNIREKISKDINVKITILQTKIENIVEKITAVENIPEICPTCSQPWPEGKDEELILSYKEQISGYNEDIQENKNILINLKNELVELQKEQKEFITYSKNILEVEKILSNIDNSLPKIPLYEDELLTEISEVEDKIKSINEEISKISLYNKDIAEYNSKIDIITQQIEKYSVEIGKLKTELEHRKELFNNLEILKKVFSTSGLVSYKLEFLIKDLEKEINAYLADFSEGRFNINFILVKDKLNVEILDNGDNITIDSLSDGEKGRVNISTLLAIRKLMSNISKTKINILFLDEIMGVLDSYGKDKLMDVLQQEDNLNTIIVSHEYEHPLVPKIEIIKKNGISKIA